jgi:rubrerythrin
MAETVELSNHAEVWRCAACSSVCLFEELLSKDWTCPNCRSPDVFPAFDHGWEREETDDDATKRLRAP